MFVIPLVNFDFVCEEKMVSYEDSFPPVYPPPEYFVILSQMKQRC